jgi:hypothetical protein
LSASAAAAASKNTATIAIAFAVVLTVESVAMRSGQEAGAPRHNCALARANAAPTMASRPLAAIRKISTLDILDIADQGDTS